MYIGSLCGIVIKEEWENGRRSLGIPSLPFADVRCTRSLESFI